MELFLPFRNHADASDDNGQNKERNCEDSMHDWFTFQRLRGQLVDLYGVRSESSDPTPAVFSVILQCDPIGRVGGQLKRFDVAIIL